MRCIKLQRYDYGRHKSANSDRDGGRRIGQGMRADGPKYFWTKKAGISSRPVLLIVTAKTKLKLRNTTKYIEEY
jgi:hypothetical protein